jgi:hypothetical protein
MSGSHLCIHRNETMQPPYFQNRIIMFCLLIPTLIYLWEIYIFPGWVCLFCCSQICGPILGIYNRSQTHECGYWDWGRTIPRKGIYKWDSRRIVAVPIYFLNKGKISARNMLILGSFSTFQSRETFPLGLKLCFTLKN